ncbi:MAG: transglycosylase domain-containing protein, partial [Alphaproteobacteria bacterium]|nr:transglycosylase domain-containing protein [Alphaproteobacteria bacterium]
PAKRAKPAKGRKPAGRATSTKTAKRPRRLWLRLLKRGLYWAAVAGIWLFIALGGLVAWYATDLPDISDLGSRARSAGITITAADGTVLANRGDVYGRHVPHGELPKALIDAVVAVEDRRFYSHFGLDPIGLARAIYVNLRAGRLVQGGSTLTQQIAKNVFLTSERSLKRKVQELLLAFWLERNFSKNELLTIYLNRVYLGAGAYGVDAAARRYFAKPASKLGLAEAAMLAGLPKAPSRYAPTRDLAAAQARAAVVLDAMVASGRLDAAAASNAKAAPARVTGSLGGSGAARYFADWVIDRVPAYVGPITGDLDVRTTLDGAAQRAAEAAVAASRAAGVEGGAGEVALVAMTPDGAVRAMVGGRNYGASQYNRATQAQRQPGSAFKIAVYAAALEAGIGRDAVFEDAPIQVEGWQPSNYGDSYRGNLTVTEAFARSSNVVAVQLSERAGRAKVIGAARRLGITAPLTPHPSLALGVGEVSLLELTGAYAVVASGGLGVVPHAIAEIRDRDGRVLYRRAGSGLGRVLAPGVAADLDALLRA